MNGPRERDRSVERLLRQSRQASQAPQDVGVTDSCLDAETLAAWADEGLSGGALELARSHVADCARCQMLIGTLARIPSTVPQTETAPSLRRWLGWLVPLAAGAAAVTAVAVWVAVPRISSPQLPRTVDELRRSAEQKASEPAALFDARDQVPANAPVANGPTDRDVTVGGKAEPLSSASGRNDRDAKVDGIRATGGAVTQEAFGAVKPEAANAVKEVATPELRRDTGRLEAQAQAGAAPAPAASALAAPPALQLDKAVGSVQAAARVAPAAAVEIASPDPAVRWRIAGSGVTRSTNGGGSWQSVSTGITSDLTAGSAPSASVCWVVGRAGVVLLSTDGIRWRRVVFPEVTDLSAVRATDTRRASVSTADGRTFTTTDAGLTWVRP